MGRSLKKAIQEQKLELERLQAEKMLERAPMGKVEVNSPLAQAVVGMRRSGEIRYLPKGNEGFVCRIRIR